MNLGCRDNIINNIKRKLEKFQQQYTDLYEFSPIAIFTLDMLNNIIDVNKAGIDLFKINKNKLVNSYFFQYVAQEDKEKLTAYLKCIEEPNFLEKKEIKFIIEDNGDMLHTQIFSKYLARYPIEKAEILLWITNITLEKTYEKNIKLLKHKLLDSNKNEIGEKIITYILNELSIPFGIIVNYATGCIKRLNQIKIKTKTKTNDLIHAMKKIIDIVDQIDNVYKRLKLFKFKNNFLYRKTDINNLLKEVINLIERDLSDLSIILHYEPAFLLSKIRIDETYIEHVFISILKNMIAAILKNGSNNPYIYIETYEKSEYIVITFTNNGFNVSKELVDDMFNIQLNISLLEIRLGLTISRAIVEAHGGKIDAFTSSKGRHKIQIFLPK